MFSGGWGLVQVLCLGGFVLAMLLPPRQRGETPDQASHRRLMHELRRHR